MIAINNGGSVFIAVLFFNVKKDFHINLLDIIITLSVKIDIVEGKLLLQSYTINTFVPFITPHTTVYDLETFVLLSWYIFAQYTSDILGKRRLRCFTKNTRNRNFT